MDATTADRVIPLPAPAAMPEREGSSAAWSTTLPMLGGVGSMLMVAGSTGASGSRGYLVGGLFLVSTVAMAVTQVVRQRRQYARRLVEGRALHRAHLGEARERARRVATTQRSGAVERLGRRLPVLAGGHRSAGSTDFGTVRVGEATVPLAAALEKSEESPVGAVDPVTSQALDAFVATWSMTPGVPVPVDLVDGGDLHLYGSEELRVAAARSLLIRLAACHAVDDLRIAVLTDRERLPEWEWLKWLPHAWSSVAHDDVGPCRLVFSDPVALPELLVGETAQLVVVLAEVPVPTLPGSAVRIVARNGATERPDHRLELDGGTSARLHRAGSPQVTLTPDLLSRPEAEAAARAVARELVGGREPGTDDAPRVDVHRALGLDHLCPAGQLPSKPVDQRLALTIGTDPSGAPVELNLRESAHGGAGPHGLVVGATGSGKSELLRTLVLGLAAQHRPDELALVLVDFKGGATFAGLGALPHVSALVTNLADDLTLVTRMEDALTGEMDRRQEVLHASGHANLREYDLARRGGAGLEPLPSLFVCVDEFSELLTARPEFVDLFVAIGRLGRSLGIHLLLATQRLEEGRLRGLESHLSYRIGLRTFSAAESRAAIGVPDAHTLPSRPGVGLLRQGATEPRRFDSFYVSGPQVPDPQAPDSASGHRPPPTGGRVPMLPFPLHPVLVGPAASPAPALAPSPGTGPEPTLLDRVVAELSRPRSSLPGSGTDRARQIWLPPLDVPSTLGDHRLHPGVVLGEVDLPREQRREPLAYDLSGAAGNFAVVGGPRSGRSTVLQSFVSSLSLAASPQEVQFLLLDLGGGALGPLGRLPHVLALARRGEDLIGRAVQEALDLVERREAAFRESGATSVAELRAITGDPVPQVHVVVDGWGTLRSEYEEQEMQLARLAGRGLTFGVHLTLATTRWNDLRPSLRDVVGSRLELRLGDPLDSEVDRRSAARVPVGRPGRGIDARARDVQTCLPRIDGSNDPSTARAGLEHLVATIVDASTGPPVRRLQVLPDRISTTDLAVRPLPDAPFADKGLLLGLEEGGADFVVLDDDPHLLVLGDDRSGRTETLRTLLHQLVATRSPSQAQVLVVDPRGGLREAVGEEHLVTHLSTRSRTVQGLAELATHLRGRLPGPEVTPQELADRSWWSGPQVYVVIDDHDLVTAGSWQESPTRPLAELLPQAEEVGLHLVLARRTDTSRAHDPVLTALRELGSSTLLLPGDPSTGAVVGHLRPRPGPPGRGRYVTRRAGVRTVQVALDDAWAPTSPAPPREDGPTPTAGSL